jgi:hypothetical protein
LAELFKLGIALKKHVEIKIVFFTIPEVKMNTIERKPYGIDYLLIFLIQNMGNPND